MQYHEAKTLFQLQSELVDTKVELAVSKSIQQVVTQIIELRQEMHQEIGGLRHEMHEMKHEMIDCFSKVEGRLSAVETVLGMRNQVRGEMRNRFFDYTFKSGWLLVIAAVSSAVSYLMAHFHHFI